MDWVFVLVWIYDEVGLVEALMVILNEAYDEFVCSILQAELLWYNRLYSHLCTNSYSGYHTLKPASFSNISNTEGKIALPSSKGMN
jgi:hypothetical protein